MNDQERKTYLDNYKKAKEEGVPFFPDIIFKDTVISLVIFIILVALAYFVGAPLEAQANPNDTSYTPRPEWYFLFLFQLLKYFPGNLEVIGAMVLPGLFIVLLIALPFIDRSPKRNFRNRPFATTAALLVVAGIGTLTYLSIHESPPPAEAVVVDRAAALYAVNCANCHGPTIDIPAGTDLHKVIAAGTHEGMPAWGGDLSADEIDALAGFILSPNGSSIYVQHCETCHAQMVQAVGNPLELQRVLDEGVNYPAHQKLEIPNWAEILSPEQKNALLNFLAAPDGQRLFAVNCSGCHGEGVAFSGTESELRDLISKGGQHLEMPAWKGTLSQSDLDALAAYVVNPGSDTTGKTLFGQHCAACHGDKVPGAPDKESARIIIGGGGAHVTMPVWGNILTIEQLDALTRYTFEVSKGSGTATGSRLFGENCSPCHGQFGQGGPNLSLPGDFIAPISSAEYLKTRDDATLRNIISQGQPDFGMSPFGSANGGQLSDDEIDALVAYIRSWEANPPVSTLPEIPTPVPAPTQLAQPGFSVKQLYVGICAQCHGMNGEGASGSAFNTEEFQSRYDDQALFDLISAGVPSTPMLGLGDLLTDDQILGLVALVREAGTGSIDLGPSTFSGQVLPIFEAKCKVCHNANKQLGGWDATSYDMVMTSGEHTPVIIPGDVNNSILAQLLLGSNGKSMPPLGGLSQAEIQAILDWILAGAENN